MNETEKASINNTKDIEHLTVKLDKALERLETLEKKQDKLDSYGWFALGVLSIATILAMGVDKAKDKFVAWILP